jgi:hypothetical protein
MHTAHCHVVRRGTHSCLLPQLQRSRFAVNYINSYLLLPQYIVTWNS